MVAGCGGKDKRHEAEVGQMGLRGAGKAVGTNGRLWRRRLKTGQHGRGHAGWGQVGGGRNKGRRQGQEKGRVEAGRGGEEECRTGWLGSGSTHT